MRARQQQRLAQMSARKKAEDIAGQLYMAFVNLPRDKQRKFRRSNLKIQLRDALDDVVNGDPSALQEVQELIDTATPADGVEGDAKAIMQGILLQNI